MGLKWLSGIGKLNKFDILNRLNITNDGTLEIDGQPQQSTGGGNVELLAIKEVWSGSSNITKTFSDSMYGFDIANDGSSDLTFTINGLTITVKSGEVFSDVFEAFTSVTITTTVPYRSTVKESLSGTLSPSNPSPSNDDTPPVISILPTSGTYTGLQQITLSSNETASIYYTIDGSTPTTSSTKYTTPFTVSANATVKYFGVDTAGNQSIVKSASYTINQPDTTPPNPVTNLAAGTTTTTSIPVSWAISNSNDVANYEVAYSTDGTNFTVASSSVNASSTSYTVSGLTSNTNYTIRVVSIDTSGNRSTAVTVTASTTVSTDTTPPNDVTNLQVSNITSTTLSLTWTASTSNDVDMYDVYQGTNLLTGTAFTSWDVGQLSPNTTYTFKVITKDTSGNSSTGVTISATTIENAPANDTTPPTITVSPFGGTYTSTQSVTLTSNETATIYYTIDGSDPTTSSSVYSSPISISANATLKYFGVDSVGNQSTIQTQTYTINTATGSWITNGLVNKWDNVTVATTVVDDGSYIPPTGDFTICTTFIPKAYISLFSQLSPNTIKISIDPSGQSVNANIYPNDVSYPVVNTTAVLTDSTAYYHYVFIKDNSGYRTYVNNVANTGLANTKTLNDSSSNITIGASGGNIKTLLYYNRALTTDELTQNYNALK